MTHLTHEQLYAYALDNARLPADEQAHLESCPQCQGELHDISALARELRIAQASEPSAAALAAYEAIFQEHGPSQRGALARAWNWVAATLVSDSRAQPLPEATRSVRADSYRLLFDSPQADIELFFEGEGQARRVQGDVIPIDTVQDAELDEGDMGDTLIQLQNSRTLDVLFETYTDQEGRFQFDAVPLGEYKLLVTGPAENLLEISELSIT